MSRVNRAVEKGESLGFMKVLVDAQSHKILGASLFGVGRDEAIHCLVDGLYAKAPFTAISRSVHIHPTVSIRAHSHPAAIAEASPMRELQGGTRYLQMRLQRMAKALALSSKRRMHQPTIDERSRAHHC
jgi:hypothetical protein